MEPRKTAKTYSPEVGARAVRMVTEHQGDHASQWAAICSIAAKIGCSGETLRGWMRQAERDQGLREGMTSETRERLKTLSGFDKDRWPDLSDPAYAAGVYKHYGVQPYWD